MKIIPNIQAQQYASLLSRPGGQKQGVEKVVRDIIARVEAGGDEALMALSQELDGQRPASLEIPAEQLRRTGADVDDMLKSAILDAKARIEAFHKAQLPKPVDMETGTGIRCCLRYFPIERVGVYIPGGTAPLLSSVLMNLVPASLAGCREVIVCTPPGAPPELLFTISLFGARVFSVGGAQAIAAMGLGTESVPRVDKLFGPGNAWVTEAKMQLSGRGIAIDMPAGPSEVLVIADQTARPEYVASDLLSQAEHGPDSQVVLLATSMAIIQAVNEAIERQLKDLPRKETAKQALEHSLAICVNSIGQALEISNFYGPEHLILAMDDPGPAAGKVNNAGSVFLGHYTPESAGDYASGTNHTLPTGGFTRAWSGITVSSFMKSITFQEISRDGLLKLAPTILQMARAEQLEAHAGAVIQRIHTKNP